MVVKGDKIPKARKTVTDRSRGEKLCTGVGCVNKLTGKAIEPIQGHYGTAE